MLARGLRRGANCRYNSDLTGDRHSRPDTTRRQAGQRRTRQRAAIAAVFTPQAGPLSAGEVLNLARMRSPGLGAATVYRALAGMLEEGQLSVVHLPGQAPRYELAGKAHHHHFHCRLCGRAFELEGCADGLHSLAPAGFRVEGHEIVLHGLCPGCAAGPP
jgi:Fur family ferric uptake transcriptional regulator